MPRIHLLYPMTLVRGFWDDVMSQAQNFITSSWTFYLQADDGKVVIFQVIYYVWLVCLVMQNKKYPTTELLEFYRKSSLHSGSQSEPQFQFAPQFELQKEEDKGDSPQTRKPSCVVLNLVLYLGHCDPSVIVTHRCIATTLPHTSEGHVTRRQHKS